MQTLSLTQGSVRKVDAGGIVRWAGVEYECQEWKGRWVITRPAGDDLVLQDERTKERRVAKRSGRARP